MPAIFGEQWFYEQAILAVDAKDRVIPSAFLSLKEKLFRVERTHKRNNGKMNFKNGFSGKRKKVEIEEFFVPPGQQYFEAYPIKPFDRNIELQKDIATPI